MNDYHTFYPLGAFSLRLDADPGMLVVWNPTPVPEPGTLGLAAAGLVGAWLGRRRLQI
jgi:hypothetical protein